MSTQSVGKGDGHVGPIYLLSLSLCFHGQKIRDAVKIQHPGQKATTRIRALTPKLDNLKSNPSAPCGIRETDSSKLSSDSIQML